jgi:peptidoglycan/LPS O-acetylase OafA/YrhL
MSAATTPAGAGPAWAGASAGRRPELDALRGIAAFMVLIEHAQQLVPPIATPALPGLGFLRWVLFDHSPLRILEYGRGAVLFFFVLSGYVLMRALLRSGSPGLMAFAAQRTVRLMLPVAASVLLSVLLYTVFFDAASLPELRDRTLGTWMDPPTLRQVIGNALLISPTEEMRLNIPLWSLVHEWRLTVLLPLVLLLRGRPLAVLVLAALAMLAGKALGSVENTIQLGEQLRGSVASTLYFALAVGSGVALAMLPPITVPDRRQRWLLLVLAAICFSMVSDIATYAGSLILIVVAEQAGGFQRLLRTAPLVWLGRASFSLYLVHVPVLLSCAYTLHGRLDPLVIAAVGTALSLPAAALMRRGVEEPSRRLARVVERRLAASRQGAG